MNPRAALPLAVSVVAIVSGGYATSENIENISSLWMIGVIVLGGVVTKLKIRHNDLLDGTRTLNYKLSYGERVWGVFALAIMASPFTYMLLKVAVSEALR